MRRRQRQPLPGPHASGPAHAGLPRPRRRFGQHFLSDRRALERLVAALAPGLGETIVEIGPGRGALTDLLVATGSPVVAIEIDRDLVRHLRARYDGVPGVKIIEGDVLAQPVADLAGPPTVLVGNVPYNVTTPILFHALAQPRPRCTVLLLQKEVAERLAAPPGGRDYGALTINVACVAGVEIMAPVPAGAFFPRPRVDSAIVRVVPLPQALCLPHEERPLRELVVALFGQRRRQVHRALRNIRGLGRDEAAVALETAGIEPAARPETLDPGAFVRLLRALRGA